jgi:hypothetical protein
VEVGLMCAQIKFEDLSKEWDLHKQRFVWPHDIKVELTPVDRVTYGRLCEKNRRAHSEYPTKSTGIRQLDT